MVGSGRGGRIKVVHVVWRLSTGGGIPQVSRQILAGLDPERFECHAVTARPAAEEDELHLLGPNVTVHPLDYTGPPNKVEELRIPLRYAAAVRRIRPDVIHAHSGTARHALPAALAVPSAGRVIEVHEPLKGGLHSEWTNRIERRLITKARFRPFAHSSDVRDATAALLGIPRARVPLVPLGVEPHVPDIAARARLRGELGVAPNTRLVVGVGRSGQKNIPLFVEVAAQVLTSLGDAGPAVAFAIVGNQGPEIRALIEELGVAKRVHLVPPLPRLQDAFDAADLFLSTSNYEGFGIAVAEAMCAGVPVVGTAVGGVNDVVENGVTGRLVRKGDRDALAAAVRELVVDEDTRTIMGEAARERAMANFTRRNMIDGFAEVYEAAANERVGVGR
ncbi:glycosyltransferase family 4 protein [Yinghuangia seranimata]|uniref:glycosyltransferase family 4 protein n=1 Tax=Yinghuangia seranimata TaxID=408067 RepID=UPI00248B90F0|nr:glycosyltransferase family 4 protein [Yinghuangia seranimata]MDI2130199.1 glycosyltransferase family 4 protein [Yinghuangia seranimata]